MREGLDIAWNTLREWGEDFWELLPNLVLALVVVALFYGLARLTKGLVEKALHRSSMSNTAVPVISNTIAFVVGVVGIMIALKLVQLDGAVSSLLAGAGVVGLALGLAFQDTASNYFAGLVLSVRRNFEVGDLIETNSVKGIVERIELRTLSLRSLDGKLLIIPNRLVFKDVLTNHTRLGERRVELAVGVSYGDDLEEVLEVTRRALATVPNRDESREPEAYFTGFGGSSIDLTCRVWIPFERQKDYTAALSHAVVAVKKAYDEAGISIPFPIRTLDFGISAGEKLSDMWPDSMAA